VKADADPITFSVLLSRFHSIANEMTLTLEHTAWTPILALARDFSCAVYDAEPRQIASFDALPIHTGSMHLVLEEIAKTFEGDVHDGDVFLCNAPYRRNTHNGDLVVAAPVFTDGEHRYWSVTRGHQLDVGAYVPTSATATAANVWQEGIQIPPVRIVDGGKERADVIDFYLSNVRYRELLNGDLLAMLGSVQTGRLRLEELSAEYGSETVLGYVDMIIDYADKRMGDEVRSIPDGVYEAETWVDSDGFGTSDIPLKVSVTVEGEDLKVDYSGSGPQSPGGINGTYATSQATSLIPFMYYISPDIPHNHGCVMHIETHAPEGTICNAEFPASTSLATIVPSDKMHDLVNMAMAQAIPDRVPAGGAHCGNLPTFSGIDEGTGVAWGVMLFNNGGGGGASKNADGWPLIATLAGLGGLKAQPIEHIELLHPLLVERMEIEPDSMGAGERIGGPGVRTSIRPLRGDVDCITSGDGMRNPPHGVFGGGAGIGGGQWVEPLAGGPRRFISACGYYRVLMSERRIGVSTGGGGYGNPLDRGVEQVRQDVRDGIITREAAQAEFGVVLSDDPDPVVDEAATEALRGKQAGDSVHLLEPTAPGGSKWLEQMMGAEDQYLLDPATP
jgi:N-methylhydantoinase B